MTHIVLFEDHTARRFRPLSDSVPVSDLRCGMFSLRERVTLLVPAGGGLRVRGHLRGPADGSPWMGADDAGPGRQLWLSGRLAPDFALLEGLVSTAATHDFIWSDEAGPVAMALGPEQARALSASWDAWQAGDQWVAWTPPVPGNWIEATDGPAGRVVAPPAALPDLATVAALGWIWELVPRTAAALAADLAWLGDREWRHSTWGVVSDGPDPAWMGIRRLETGIARLPGRVDVTDPAALYRGPDVEIAAGVVIDTRPGPVVLDRGVSIEPHVLLEGPLYLGDGSRVKAGARLYGESSFGLVNRLAGEIGESTFGDFVNKQHDGFIGHAALGSWINLGAMTTCSDLKNNYGVVRVDLGEGPVDTGQRFVGLLAGDHVKTAIGTLFNTGTVAGFASNIFGGGMPPKLVDAFSWGGAEDAPRYDVERAIATATTVMSRRGCTFTPAHADLFRHLAAAGR